MLQSESTSSGDDGLSGETPGDDFAQAENDDSGGDSGQRYVRTYDPVVRWLVLAIIAVVILWLAGVLGALVFGLTSPSGAPRTAIERDIDVLSSQIQSGQADTTTWSKYIDALVNAGQYGKATDAANVALKTVKIDKSYIQASEANIFLAQKDYANATAIATQAMASATSEYNAALTLNKTKKITAGTEMPASWGTAALIKAQALAGAKDYAGAIKSYGDYLAKNPTDSDVLTARGTLKAVSGDNAGAAVDYRAALKFIPDYKPALDGLKKIGAGVQ